MTTMQSNSPLRSFIKTAYVNDVSQETAWKLWKLAAHDLRGLEASHSFFTMEWKDCEDQKYTYQFRLNS